MENELPNHNIANGAHDWVFMCQGCELTSLSPRSTETPLRRNGQQPVVVPILPPSELAHSDVPEDESPDDEFIIILDL